VSAFWRSTGKAAHLQSWFFLLVGCSRRSRQALSGKAKGLDERQVGPAADEASQLLVETIPKGLVRRPEGKSAATRRQGGVVKRHGPFHVGVLISQLLDAWRRKGQAVRQAARAISGDSPVTRPWASTKAKGGSTAWPMRTTPVRAMRSAAFSETLRRDQDPARTAARIMPPAAATGHRRARACPPHGPLAFDCACFAPSPIAVLPGLRHKLSLSTKANLFAIQQLHLSHFFPKHTACLEFLRALWNPMRALAPFGSLIFRQGLGRQGYAVRRLFSGLPL